MIVEVSLIIAAAVCLWIILIGIRDFREYERQYRDIAWYNCVERDRLKLFYINMKGKRFRDAQVDMFKRMSKS